ncbi:hypothetical protein SARC_05307 [Sphaeroforma arctica JP610]|uniref:DNA-(apurinic or apyrimidinic site) endonuclease n=1 Tax=Sphaeroforma arctica JP610 TaxID=667725 RepID=A0A0L0G0P7_9EUKA|nr:hypothetical protein SARC_05307 [Sphaeroforma arctica JP610]KNC82411.1 hypothetical protein SARC_05307 [Sphaeroforma arctica JP610]|eukprot:XP_014156313.1 hypothetical protein SARC_05307 [Sphaeroforma arctica JP610]
MLQTSARFVRLNLQNFRTMSTRPSRKCKAVSNLNPMNGKKQRTGEKVTKITKESESIKSLGVECSNNSNNDASREVAPSPKKQKAQSEAAVPRNTSSSGEVSQTRTETDQATAIAAKKAKAADARLAKQAERPMFERTPMTRKYKAGSEQAFVAVAWNVAGLRAVLRTPQRIESFRRLVDVEKPDYLLIQEHKLQGKDVEEIETALEPYIPGYESHWVSSTGKKGYSGVAVFLKYPVRNTPSDKQVADAGDGKNCANAKPNKEKKGKQASLKDMFGIKKDVEQELVSETSSTKTMKNSDSQMYRAINVTMPKIEGASDEGRVITVEYPHFYMVGAYVPNSGQNLARLEYRIGGWNKSLNAYMKELEKTKPVILGGDLNVAHTDQDVYNPEAKHIPKSAGTTPQERRAFSELLSDGEMVDTFRHYHPDARGAFSYWSMRVNNRVVNRGMRLDYFVASKILVDNTAKSSETTDQSTDATEKPALASKNATPYKTQGAQILDAWISPEYNGSDHCPVGIAIAIDSFKDIAF